MNKLEYSEYNNFQNIKIGDINRSLRNKTYKRRETFKPTKKLENFLKTMNNDEDDDDDQKANFVPLNDEQKNEQKNEQKDTPPSSIEELNSHATATEFYKQHIPYYNEATNSPILTTSDELLEKLNYMITLIESQKEEKTDNVTEELVLYLFLGVFVIFVVDSFARAGKYIR